MLVGFNPEVSIFIKFFHNGFNHQLFIVLEIEEDGDMRELPLHKRQTGQYDPDERLEEIPLNPAEKPLKPDEKLVMPGA